MLQGIRDLPELKGKIESIEKQLNEGVEKIRLKQIEQSEQIEELKNKISELSSQTGTSISEANRDLLKIKDLKEEFEKTLRRFQHEHDKAADNLFNSISTKIDDNLMHLKKNTQTFKALEPEVKDVVAQMSELKQEMSRLIAATKKISEMDFELKNYAKTLKESNEEKLRLMQDVSNLKKLVAKERRKR